MTVAVVGPTVDVALFAAAKVNELVVITLWTVYRPERGIPPTVVETPT